MLVVVVAVVVVFPALILELSAIAPCAQEPPEPIYCNLCDFWLNGKKQYEAHFTWRTIIKKHRKFQQAFVVVVLVVVVAVAVVVVVVVVVVGSCSSSSSSRRRSSGGSR